MLRFENLNAEYNSIASGIQLGQDNMGPPHARDSTTVRRVSLISERHKILYTCKRAKVTKSSIKQQITGNVAGYLSGNRTGTSEVFKSKRGEVSNIVIRN
jgi:hypothetical protein